MALQDFKLIGFAPDLPVTTPGTFARTTWCVPTDRGIGAWPRVTEDSSSALNTGPLNGAVVSNTSATQEAIIGTATKLYSFDMVTTLTDRSGAAYNASTTDTWSVTNFGNIAIAANRNDQLQQRTIAAAANFASVGAAPVPKASIVVTCGPVTAPFVMVFDYLDGVNTDKDGWKCSAIGDYTGWTAGTNSCATGRLLDNVPGPVTAAIPYRDGVIAWKRTGMYVGRYDGPPQIWSWQRISSDVGCIGKNACVEAEDTIYFADDTGVWMFDGSYPRRVPGYIEKWWVDQIISATPTTADRNFYKVLYDKPKHLLWFLASTSTVTNSVGSGLAYNTISQRWCCVEGVQFINAGGTILVREIISPRLTVNATSLKIGSLQWGALGGEPHSSLLVGWAFSDQVNHPKIKGIRPHWSVGPTTATSNWIAGNVEVLPYERALQPGAGASVSTNVAAAFRQPGKLDAVASGEVLGFDFTVIAGIDWEITGISVDVEFAGKS